MLICHKNRCSLHIDEPCKSIPNGLPITGEIIKWLDDEIERAEYPVGGLDMDRTDRKDLAMWAKKAKLCIERIQSYGR